MARIKDVKFTLERNSIFHKELRWKDKNDEPINLGGYEFQSQFRFNFGENNILCTLTTEENGGIIVVPEHGTIILHISAEINSQLKNYDSGIWSLDVKMPGRESFQRLISGRWVAEPDITINT